ncbi:MAG: 2-hydroxyacyl-CoA dehydratase [Polyangiaceae bacterium]|nr:2-hydroxyacyl-CoA dehydratase [Polyangiaceae bacterium]
MSSFGERAGDGARLVTLGRGPANPPAIGWLCNYTPVEILTGLGLQPYRVLGDYQKPSRVDAFLHSNVCPYIRSCFDVALRGGYASLGGVIFNNSCMAMGNLSEYWEQYGKTPFVHLLEVPRNADAPAEEFYLTGLRALVDALCARFGSTYSEERMRAAIEAQNRVRAALRELSALRVTHPEALPSSRLLEAVEEGFYIPVDQHLATLEALRDEIRREPAGGFGGRRILITGAHQLFPGVERLMEESGLHVVHDDLCTGARYYEKDIPLDGDPLRALARAYLRQPSCARMSDQADRHDRLLSIIRELDAEGVICCLNRFCCTFTYDFATLRRRLDAASIPNLLVEGDYTSGNQEQLRTRFQAFAELLEIRGMDRAPSGRDQVQEGQGHE